MDVSTFVVREAGPADASALVRLVNGAYRGDEGRTGWTSEAALVAGPRIDAPGLLALIGRPGSALLVLEAAGALLACVHLEVDAEGSCSLGMLSVEVASQGSGVGRVLLGKAEAFARERLRARMSVLHVVSIREELLAWYERRGYRRTGALVPFEPRPTQRSLVGALQFARLEKLL